MQFERLTYVSHATDPAESVMAASDILEQSVRKNPRNNITGALAFTPSRFVQVLEGSHGSLDVLLLKLAMDPRHHDMIVLARIPIQHRLFSDWSMIAPVFTPQGRARLVALVADQTPPFGALNELIYEMWAEQGSATARSPSPEVQ
ncbi:BLUF domain-containing protein [Brevundimonas sp. SL161]|uniref:BLUF domain-containing protein n=1 Tax=Brevundimonas sp. SL161 TaxID=2804613 RepID=UPI003CF97C16